MANFFNITEVQQAERDVIFVLAGGGTEAFDREGYNLSCEAAGIPTHGNLLGAEFKAAREAAKASEPKAAEAFGPDATATEIAAAWATERGWSEKRIAQAGRRAEGVLKAGKAKSAAQAATLVLRWMKAENNKARARA